VNFYDMDKEIEEQQQASVSEIFASRGEEYFRSLEREMIEHLLSLPPSIIATGGGAFMQADIRRVIAEKAISLWLDAPMDVLTERVSRRHTRPLLERGDKRTILEQLYYERAPLYATADWRVESSGAEHEIVVKKVLQKIQEQS
jgi:shikimate kinase